MTVPIVDYVKHTNVNGSQGLLAHLYAFLLAQGWTINEYLTSRNWVNGTGWTSGGFRDVLDVVSNGYGGQDLHYRFEAYPDQGSETTVSWLWHTPIIPGNPTYSIATSTRPLLQNQWQDGRWYDSNMPNGTFPALWIFGYGQKYCCWIAQITTEWCIGGAFGTVMLLPEFYTENNYQFHWSGCYSDNFPNSYWYNIATYHARWGMFTAPADNTDAWKCMYDTVRGGAYYNNAARANCFVARGGGRSGHFGDLSTAMNYNGFTNKYVGVQPTWYYNYQPTAQWHVLGNLPLINLTTLGLGFGEEIEFGSDQYLAFPRCRISDSLGLAFRIS